MDKSKIGENAGIIWRMMDNNKHWEYGELKKATGLSDRERMLPSAGWHEKIRYNSTPTNRGKKNIFTSTSICLSDNRFPSLVRNQ